MLARGSSLTVELRLIVLKKGTCAHASVSQIWPNCVLCNTQRQHVNTAAAQRASMLTNTKILKDARVTDPSCMIESR